MLAQFGAGRAQRRVLPGGLAGGEFVFGQAVAGDRTLEQLERQRFARCVFEVHAVDVAGSALAQPLGHAQPAPGDAGQRRRRRAVPAQRVARQGQPGQARQFGEPAGQLGEAVGRQAQQLQALRVGQPRRQRIEAVAREHELLQRRALAQFGGQLFDGVVGQDEPAQLGRQRRGGHLLDAVGLEADHLQRRAVTQRCGQVGEMVAGTENDLQPVQPAQVGRQFVQAVAGEVEHLQRVGQVEHLGR